MANIVAVCAKKPVALVVLNMAFEELVLKEVLVLVFPLRRTKTKLTTVTVMTTRRVNTNANTAVLPVVQR